METVETILIKGEDGTALRINASDFKVGKHEFFEESKDESGSSGGDGDPTQQPGAGGQPGQGTPGQQQPAQQPATPAGAPRGAAKPA